MAGHTPPRHGVSWDRVGPSLAGPPDRKDPREQAEIARKLAQDRRAPIQPQPPPQPLQRHGALDQTAPTPVEIAQTAQQLGLETMPSRRTPSAAPEQAFVSLPERSPTPPPSPSVVAAQARAAGLDVGAAVAASQAQGAPAVQVQVDRHQILPVKTLDAFYETLPSATVQFLVAAHETRVSATTLVAGATIDVLDVTVPDKYVWVITDVQIFGLCPSRDLEAPMIPIEAEQLAGLITFDVTTANRQPLRVESKVVDPYAAVSAGAATKVGWPFAQTSLAPSRGTFALYARSQQHVKVQALVATAPRFWLSVLGARLTGFSLPEISFDDVLRGRG